MKKTLFSDFSEGVYESMSSKVPFPRASTSALEIIEGETVGVESGAEPFLLGAMPCRSVLCVCWWLGIEEVKKDLLFG